jgi:hypothetical protein
MNHHIVFLAATDLVSTILTVLVIGWSSFVLTIISKMSQIPPKHRILLIAIAMIISAGLAISAILTIIYIQQHDIR